MIESSELIINQQGRIYHLDLSPGEIGDIIITVGDPGRVEQVSKHFDKIEVKRAHREFVTHTGTVNNKRISVVSTGIGTDNIDIVLNELDALANIDFRTREVKDQLTSLKIIRLGTCGSLHRNIEVDSFVAAQSAIGLDNLLLYYNVANDNQPLLDSFLQHTFPSQSMSAYHFNANEILLKQFSPGIKTGISVTCSGFYGPQGRVLRAPLRFSNLIDKLATFNYTDKGTAHRILNFEMETSGIYGMSRLLGHRALALNVIVANRASKQFSKDVNAAVEKLIGHFFECVE